MNKAIRGLSLPQNCVIAGIIRRGEILMPRGVDDPAREILAKLLSIPKIKSASGMEADFYIKLLA